MNDYTKWSVVHQRQLVNVSHDTNLFSGVGLLVEDPLTIQWLNVTIAGCLYRPHKCRPIDNFVAVRREVVMHGLGKYVCANLVAHGVEIEGTFGIGQHVVAI